MRSKNRVWVKRSHYGVRGKRHKNRVQGNSRVRMQSIEGEDDVDSAQGAEGCATVVNALPASKCVLSYMYYAIFVFAICQSNYFVVCCFSVSTNLDYRAT